MPFSLSNQMDNGPSTSSLNQETPEVPPRFPPRAAPTLAGANEMADIRMLLREWVTSISGTTPGQMTRHAAFYWFTLDGFRLVPPRTHGRGRAAGGEILH